MKTSSERYWQNSFGDIAINRKTIALLTEERPSVRSLFLVIVAQAFTRPIPIRQEDDTYAIWGPGTRPWSLRSLADAAGFGSVNTVVSGIKRLTKLGLIQRLANKFGTVIQVVNYYLFRKKAANDWGAPLNKTSFLTPLGDTLKSKNDPYNGDPKIVNRSSSSSIVVDTSERVIFSERETPEPKKETLESLLGLLKSPFLRSKLSV